MRIPRRFWLMNRNSSHHRQPTPSEIVAHLRRLGRASNAAEVVRELESLGPRLGPHSRLSGLALPSLTALAEAHLRERLEPARDPLTGTLTDDAFAELWRAHARHAQLANDDRAAVAVTITLLAGQDPGRDRSVALQLRAIANTCAESVAAGDYVGRTGLTTISVLPRNGGRRGARTVAARLLDACREALIALELPARLELELRDPQGQASERQTLVLGFES